MANSITIVKDISDDIKTFIEDIFDDKTIEFIPAPSAMEKNSGFYRNSDIIYVGFEPKAIQVDPGRDLSPNTFGYIQTWEFEFIMPFLESGVSDEDKIRTNINNYNDVYHFMNEARTQYLGSGDNIIEANPISASDPNTKLLEEKSIITVQIQVKLRT